MKKIIFLIFACIVLAIPCFADNEQFVDSISVSSYSTSYTSGTGFVYGKYNSSSNSHISIFGISDNNISTVSLFNHGEYLMSSKNVNYSLGSSSYYRTDSAVMTQPANYDWNPAISVFPYDTNDDDIAVAFEQYLNNLPSIGNEVNFTLPRGNVLYFKVAENQNVHFTSDFMANSALLSSGTYGPWGDTQQRFGAVSDLPTSSTVFPLSTQNPITWYKSPNQNILGQTKTGSTYISCVTGHYYCFYNPAFSYVSDTLERDSVGGTVHVNGKFSEIKIYPLSQQLTIENGQILMPSDSNDDYASYFNGTSNENGTVTFTDQDGNIGLPVNGGQNQQDAPISAQGLIESIKSTLQNILREIESLFTFGYEAIQSLVSTISDFTSVFSQLYTWLPSPVYQALISAIIIAITIGVFKVFL